MTTYEPIITTPSTVAAIGERYGLSGFAPFQGGETGALFYTCTGVDGLTRVLKLAAGDISAAEIEDNTYGYETLRSIGAEDLLPRGIVSGSYDGTPFILMPHLGNDLMYNAQTGRTDIYPTFLDAMRSVTANTVRGGSDAHQQGLAEFRDQVVRWYEILEQRGCLDSRDIANLKSLDLTSLASGRASLMLLDFTPNNVFVGDGRVTFIDPWRQGTYLGSIIPSMAQFQTLLEVRDVPGSKEYAAEFDKYIVQMGGQLDLAPEQVRKQKLLGACLQYALSGLVRIDSDPERSTALLESSKRAIGGVAGD